MARCCGGGSGGCTCKIVVGGGLTIEGSGGADDAYVIYGASANVNGVTNSQFQVVVTGEGTADVPLQIETVYASTAKLQNVPDVHISGVTSGQVLGWDATNNRWNNVNPVTAPVGAVQHDGTLIGDGSGGNKLAVVGYSARGMTTDATNGVSIRDTYINQMVRKFADAPARTAADPPANTLNTMTVRSNAPGQIEYWDGSTWRALDNNIDTVLIGNEFLVLSGPYTPGMRMTHMVREVTTTVDSSSHFTVLGTAALAGYSGVLVCNYGANAQAPPYYCSLWADTGKVVATARKATDGTLLPPGSDVHGYADAWLY